MGILPQKLKEYKLQFIFFGKINEKKNKNKKERKKERKQERKKKRRKKRKKQFSDWDGWCHGDHVPFRFQMFHWKRISGDYVP